MREPAVPPGAVTAFDERLSVPLRWWAQATMFLASLWLAFVVAMPATVAFGATAVAGLLLTWLFLGYGAARVRVSDGTFLAGGASIPVTLLANPLPLDRAAAQRLAGRDANASAFHLLRPYVREAVKVTVDDPRDAVPYWLIATRRPQELAAALVASGARPGDGTRSIE